MVRYAQNRFVDVELILEDQSGLKIPKSAITKKDFYVIPEDYLTQGGNSNSTGVLIDTGKENAEFQAVDIYTAIHRPVLSMLIRMILKKIQP